MKFVRHLPKRPHHLWMSRMTNEDQLIRIGIIPIDFIMDFNHQGTGRINDLEIPLLGFFPNGFGDPMGTEDDAAFFWYVQSGDDQALDLIAEILHN